MKERRDRWFADLAGVRVGDLVFLDEFGATTHMTRTHARGPRGQRVVAKVPHGHWSVLSTVAAMTVGGGIVTAATFDAAVDTGAFLAFVERCLVPTLRPGQVVVMDNLSAHKSPRVAERIEACGARVVYLPPYSPDYNPIEQAISKVKATLRRLAVRTVEGLFEAIGTALRTVTADDAANYARHCGYATIR